MKFSTTLLTGLVLSLVCSVTNAGPGAAFGMNNNNYGSQNQMQQGMQLSTQQRAAFHMGTQGFGSPGSGNQNHQQGMQQFGLPGGQSRMHGTLDENSDGVITLDEFLMRADTNIEYRFDRHDIDNDGLLSETEYAGMHRYPTENGIDQSVLESCVSEGMGGDSMYLLNSQLLFVDVDTNGDGFIDLEEFYAARTAALSTRFHAMDQDADGVISVLELGGALGTMREHRNIHRQCIEEQQDINELIES